MNIKKSFLIFTVVAVIFIIFPKVGFSQKETVTEKDFFKVKPLTLEWPFNKHTGFVNYAQELVFNKNMGFEYLEKAKKYYINGYNLISNYQIQTNVYDLYVRDTFKVDAASLFGQGVYRDFRLAEYWFIGALKIIARNIEWDPQVAADPEYKQLLENTFKNLVYVTIYKGDFYRTLDYLDEYKNFAPDQDFIDEWESRALGNIVLLHKKYDWAFTGKKTYAYKMKKHREFILKVIEKRYSDNPKLKKELEDRIYPQFKIHSKEKRTEETSKEDPTTK